MLKLPSDADKDEIISAGNFRFSNEVFTRARAQLLSAFYNNPEWLIIDEFGKLEINDKGLEPAISNILNDLNSHTNTNVVIVVRDYLVSDFLNKYGLTDNDIKNLEM